MLKEIFKNMTGRKKAVPFPEGFSVADKDKAIFTDLHRQVNKIFGRSLRIRLVDAGSCNACEWECSALANPFYDIQRFGIDFVASPRHADILLVTGPVTRQMELALKKVYLAMPEPKFVIGCGDCTMDGGIYKGSYAVNNGVADVLNVDCYIPGCPPSPLGLISGLKLFMDNLKNT